jgi:hypothetical protein
MRIVHSTAKDYAYIEWEKDEEKQIGKMQGELLNAAVRENLQQDLCVEISKTDVVSETVRHSLLDGRFLMIE